MKNKSKLKKIRQGAESTPKMPGEWLYMNSQVITVCDIKEALKGDTDISIEIWEEAGVLEIEIPEQKSIDFEQTGLDFGDECSNAYLKEHDVKSLFFVTLDAANYVNVHKILQKIVGKLGGFFCGDTEDFSPVIK